MNRRSYLALCAAVGVSGCTGLFDQDIYLGGLRVENETETEKSLDIHISKDGDVIHETTVENVPGMHETDDGDQTIGTDFVECAWSNDEQGEFEIAARLPQNDSWVETTSDDTESDDSCQMAFLRIGTTERLTFSWDSCERYEEERPDTVCEYGTE